MTTLDREPTTGTAGAAGAPPGRSGRRTVASVVLAVAILATGGVAVGYLATDQGAPTTSTTAGPAPTPAAAPAPSAAPAAAPAPSSPVPAPASPAPAPGGPVVVDTANTPLPAPVAGGVQSVFANLSAGDVAALQASYVPGRTVRAAPWPAVADLLAQPTARAGLLGALRTAPTRSPEGWRYTAPDGNQVGVDTQGHIAFVRLQ